MLKKPLIEYNGKDVLKFWLAFELFKGFANGMTGQILPYLKKDQTKLRGWEEQPYSKSESTERL